MIKVKKGQDPYSVIGQYIRDHVSAIEDMIAVIEIDGKTSNELFMVDMTVDGYFIWESDWYEGEENVVLIDFFPVSDACNPKDHWIPCSERLPEEDYWTGLGKQFSADVLMTVFNTIDDETIIDLGHTVDGEWYSETTDCYIPHGWKVLAWMPLPEPWKGEQE